MVADNHGDVSYAIISLTFGAYLGFVTLELVFFLDTDVRLCFILCLAFLGWIVFDLCCNLICFSFDLVYDLVSLSFLCIF